MKIPPLRALLQPLPVAALALAASAATLAGALTIQSLGFEPCELCLKQRLPYYAALPLAAAAVFFASNGRTAAARVLLGLLAAVFLGSVVLSVYHAGVEWKLWAGPTDCTGNFVKPASMEAFRQQLRNTRVVRCDEVSLRLFGLSLAEWNVLLSTGLALLAALGAAARKRS